MGAELDEALALAPAREDDPVLAREAQLVSRIRRGDTRAYATLVRTHQDRVFDLAYRMLGSRDEAEDLAQEIFATLHKALPRFRGESRLSTWIFRVARNHCLNRLKYLERRGALSLDDLPDAVDVDDDFRERRPDNALEQSELQRLVQKAIATLPPEHRELVVMRDIEGLTYEEMVAVTQQPEGTVKSRLHRARAALAREIGRLRKEQGE